MSEFMFTDEQIEVLLRPIKPSRVSTAQGYSHMEAYDVRAMLIRVFGFGGWDETAVTPTELVFEEETKTSSNKPAWRVCYRSSRRLTVRGHNGTTCVYEGSAIGENLQPSRADAHDTALKTAESQALKRCVTNLGDQFGLSLYNQGSLRPLVYRVVGFEHTAVDGGDDE